jgi:hypothetical protein
MAKINFKEMGQDLGINQNAKPFSSTSYLPESSCSTRFIAWNQRYALSSILGVSHFCFVFGPVSGRGEY